MLHFLLLPAIPKGYSSNWSCVYCFVLKFQPVSWVYSDSLCLSILHFCIDTRAYSICIWSPSNYPHPSINGQFTSFAHFLLFYCVPVQFWKLLIYSRLGFFVRHMTYTYFLPIFICINFSQSKHFILGKYFSSDYFFCGL